MSYQQLYHDLAQVFDGDTEIESLARTELLRADASQIRVRDAVPMPGAVREVLLAPDARPLCRSIAELPFAWAPPTSSPDPLYVQHSTYKVHVELLGPDGLVRTDQTRIGLYGMLPQSEYGLRTHPAEELYVMLAGDAWWMRGDATYAKEGPLGRSYHASGLPHASMTKARAFLAIYAWRGDVSTDQYAYAGLPGA